MGVLYRSVSLSASS